MDRREALKNLGIGAAALTTGTVASVPVPAAETKPEPAIKPERRTSYHQIPVIDMKGEGPDFLHFFMTGAYLKDDFLTFEISKFKVNEETRIVGKSLSDIFNELPLITSSWRSVGHRFLEVKKMQNRITSDCRRGPGNVLWHGGTLPEGVGNPMQTIEYLKGLDGLVMAYMGNLEYDVPLIAFQHVKGIEGKVFVKHPKFDRYVKRFRFV